jgi:hypothetical protein
MTRPARHLLGVLAPAALVLALLAATPAAGARGGSSPVTTSDTVTSYPGNFPTVKLLDNDSDADGDTLTVCTTGTESYPRIAADFSKTDVAFSIKSSAKPGSYSYTYFACDGTTQVAGTVTLVVAAPPRIKVRQVSNGLGKLRVTSKAPFKIRLGYGSFAEEDADGYVTVGKNGSAVFTVHRTKIDWLATTLGGEVLAAGHLRGILLPRRG